MPYEQHWKQREGAREALIAAVVADVTDRVHRSPQLQRDPDAICDALSRCWDTEASWIDDARQESFSRLIDVFPQIESKD